MTDPAKLDRAIRDRLGEVGLDEMRNVLLFLVGEHEDRHRLLGPPNEDHTGEGLPLCAGWPYRERSRSICRYMRVIAEKLGIEAELYGDDAT